VHSVVACASGVSTACASTTGFGSAEAQPASTTAIPKAPTRSHPLVINSPPRSYFAIQP
jgi:hypothetical protein